MADRYGNAGDEATVEPEVKLDEGIDPKYAGKSTKELADALKEMESSFGKREQEFGELKKRLSTMEEETRRVQYEARMKEFYAQQEIENARRASESKREPKPISEDEYDITKPVSSTVKIVRDELKEAFNALKEEQQKQEMKSRGETAKRLYEQGFKSALRGNPELMQGVEQDVQNAMYDAYSRGKIGLDDLGNEDMWHMMARNAKWLKGEEVPTPRAKERSEERSFADVPVRVSPSSAQTGAVPTQVREATRENILGDVKFDEKSYEIMRKMNIDEEEAKKRILYERQGRVA
jgi:regulator of replication initiation timing